MIRKWMKVLVVLAASYLGLQHAAAQVPTGDIIGTVTDTTGAIIPNAQVTIKNADTGATRRVPSDGDGNFAASLLEVGNYSVSTAVSGFKQFKADNVHLASGDRTRVNVHLEVGSSDQTVEVQADTSGTLQTDSSVVGGLLTTQAVRDLPVNGRDVIKLVQLLPGAQEGSTDAVSGGSRPDDRRQTASVSFNSQSETLNSYLIDGLDNNERVVATIGVNPSIDALQEVKVQSGIFTADTGRAGSGVINMVTKSGSNQVHGSVYEFLRNDFFDAKDYFNRPQGTNPFAGKRPKYRQNQFGSSVGGPVRKGKLFYFGDYEGLRIVQGQTGVAAVPTPCELGQASCNGVTQLGNFSDLTTPIYDPTVPGGNSPFPNNVIPLSRINPIAKNYASLFPVVSTCVSGAQSCNYVNNPVRRQTSDVFDVRGDDQLSERQSIFARYSFNNVVTVTPGLLPSVTVAGVTVQPGGTPQAISFPGIAHQKYHQAALSYTDAIKPNLLLQLSLGYLRGTAQTNPANFGTNASAAFGLHNINLNSVSSALSLVTFNNGGYVTLGDASNLPIIDQDNTFDYEGSLVYTKGNHVFRVSGGFIRRDADNTQIQYPNGNFQFSSQQTNSNEGGSGGTGGNSFASLLIGVPVQQQRTLSLVSSQLRTTEAHAFIQDDWRATSILTLNSGLRWDVFTPYTEKRNYLSNFDPTDADTLASAHVQVAGQNGVSRTAGIATNYANFQPRVGFGLTAAPKTVLRGGFTVVNFPTNYLSASVLRNTPFTSIFLLEHSSWGPLELHFLPLDQAFRSRRQPTPAFLQVAARPMLQA